MPRFILSCDYHGMRTDMAMRAIKEVVAQSHEAAAQQVTKEIKAGTFYGVNVDTWDTVVVPRERIIHIDVDAV